jgi:hypothetical protein
MVVDRTVRQRRVDSGKGKGADEDVAWRKTTDQMKDALKKADFRTIDQKKRDLRASLKKSQAKKMSDEAWKKARATG